MVKKAFKFEADEEVADPVIALKIQLEMMQQRVGLALNALKDGKKRGLQEQVKAVRSIAIAIHNLGYGLERTSNDDVRMITALRECKYSSESNVAAVKEDRDLVDIQGLFDIKKMSRRFLW